MSEEEILKRAEEVMQDWEQDDDLIQGLLDLYNQEKEKNKKLEEVIYMMAEEITDFTGSCPADIFDKEWDEEEGDCEHCKSTDKECFIKYYFKKARGEENETN